GLKECRKALTQKPKGLPGFFTLDALRVWAERLHGSDDKQSWDRVFPPGPNLWRGLTGIYSYIEHYGTGGGRCRPLSADFLTEAGEAVKDRKLRDLAQRYTELGQAWSALAEAALPDDVPLFAEAKKLHARKAELTAAGNAVDELHATWAKL